MRADTVFDLASLTKVIVTTTAVMQLLEAGRLDLDFCVSQYWPEFACNGKDRITVPELLTHTSGLRPFRLSGRRRRKKINVTPRV